MDNVRLVYSVCVVFCNLILFWNAVVGGCDRGTHGIWLTGDWIRYACVADGDTCFPYAWREAVYRELSRDSAVFHASGVPNPLGVLVTAIFAVHILQTLLGHRLPTLLNVLFALAAVVVLVDFLWSQHPDGLYCPDDHYWMLEGRLCFAEDGVPDGCNPEPPNKFTGESKFAVFVLVFSTTVYALCLVVDDCVRRADRQSMRAPMPMTTVARDNEKLHEIRRGLLAASQTDFQELVDHGLVDRLDRLDLNQEGDEGV